MGQNPFGTFCSFCPKNSCDLCVLCGEKSVSTTDRTDDTDERLDRHARAIAAVMGRSGTIAKCSAPFSSYETITDVFRVEKLTKSRRGTSNNRPEAVSILNGLFEAVNSSRSEASIGSPKFNHQSAFAQPAFA
jgi:hypothetical protein